MCRILRDVLMRYLGCFEGAPNDINKPSVYGPVGFFISFIGTLIIRSSHSNGSIRSRGSPLNKRTRKKLRRFICTFL